MMGKRGTFERRLWMAKAPLELSRKPVFGLDCYGRLYEKERESRGFEQARSDDLLSLFLRAPRARTAQPSGPAASLCGCARGGPPFHCGETSGLHYRAAAAAYPPARFCRSKNGDHLSHKSTKRQSAEQRSAGLRSKLKKGTEAEGRACSHTRIQSPFS